MGQVWYLIVSIPDLCTLLTYICQFLMILFRPNFNDKRDDFDSEIVYFPFLGGNVHTMESISLNSFVLLEHLAILLTSTFAIDC